jgi:hypothetical protein
VQLAARVLVQVAELELNRAGLESLNRELQTELREATDPVARLKMAEKDMHQGWNDGTSPAKYGASESRDGCRKTRPGCDPLRRTVYS